MKKIKLTQFLLLFVCVLGLTSCSGDDDSAPFPSPLAGRWVGRNASYVLNSDKTGYYELDLRASGSGVVKEYFTWSSSDVQLFLYYKGLQGM